MLDVWRKLIYTISLEYEEMNGTLIAIKPVEVMKWDYGPQVPIRVRVREINHKSMLIKKGQARARDKKKEKWK